MIRPVLAGGRAPAAKAALALVAGTLAGTYADGGAAAAEALAAVSGLSLVWLSTRGSESPASRLAFFGLWTGVGFASGFLRVGAPGREAGHLYASLRDARPADVVAGTLSDFWSGQPPRARTTLKAERLRVGSHWRDFHAEVVVFVSGETPVATTADRGDRVEMTGRLEEEDLPASDREPAPPRPSFRLSVKSARLVERQGATLLSALTWPNRWLFARLAQAPERGEFFERDVRGPLAALLLGRTSELDRGMVARYRRGGLYHLLVVSGLHVVLEAGLVLFLLSIVRVEGRARDLVLLAAVFLFVLVGGANPPAVRAGVVVAVFLVTRLLERPIAAAQAIGLSALALFLAAPASLYSVGTVLTFAAVCGIALFTRPIRGRLPERPEWLWSGLAGTLAAEAATAPVLFWRFNIVAAGAWLTAPLAIPLSAALIGLGGTLLACYAAGLPGGPLAGLFALGTRALGWLADRSAGAAFLRPTPPLAGIGAVELLLAAAALGPRRFRAAAAWSAAAVFGFLALRPGAAGPERGLSIEALDVGQGDAILLRWKRRAILVDGGGPFDPEATEFGRTRVIPKLLDRGVTRLDAVVLTHPHPDHALGLFAVLEELPVSTLWHSSGADDGSFHDRLAETAGRRGVAVRALVSGDVFEADGLTAGVLHSGGSMRKVDGVNNQSLVLLVEREGRSALLTGDIGAPTEMALASAERGLLRADVLKVAHHGSRTSTTAPFVDAVAPRVALLSCGRQNRFGHPARPTLETLGRRCVPVLRTDQRSDCRVDLLPGGTRLAWRGLERP